MINPVRDLEAGPRPVRDDQQFRFECTAHLSWQKGQDIFLRAFAIAKPEIPSVQLTPPGSEPDEAFLRGLTTQLGLDDIVDFAGYVSDPRANLLDADCFVLASRWEGFGVALAEATQFGLPVLSTDCDFGPGGLISDLRLGGCRDRRPRGARRRAGARRGVPAQPPKRAVPRFDRGAVRTTSSECGSCGDHPGPGCAVCVTVTEAGGLARMPSTG